MAASTSVAGSTGSTSSASSSSGAANGGSSSSSSASSSSGGTGGALTGTINFAQSGDQFSFGAAFDALSACVATPTSSAACSFITCTPDAPQFSDGAGELTIAGGSIPAGTVVTDVGFGGYSYNGFVTWMEPGQSVTVVGAGGKVPAFGPWAVTVPQPITLTGPAVTNGGATPVSIATDLTVSWTGAESGTSVTFTLLGPNPFTTLSCTWDSAPGQGTIPSALLASVAGPQMGATSPVTFSVHTTKSFSAGPYTVAMTAALGSGGSIALQ